MPTSRLILASLLLFATPLALPAQSLELPVLAVDHQHRPVDGIHLDELKIKAGPGAPFAPTALRKAGDDPISLAIFIDASRDSWHDLKQLADDLPALVGSQLLPADPDLPLRRRLRHDALAAERPARRHRPPQSRR